MSEVFTKETGANTGNLTVSGFNSLLMDLIDLNLVDKAFESLGLKDGKDFTTADIERWKKDFQQTTKDVGLRNDFYTRKIDILFSKCKEDVQSILNREGFDCEGFYEIHDRKSFAFLEESDLSDETKRQLFICVNGLMDEVFLMKEEAIKSREEVELTREKNPPKHIERDKENELYLWLDSRGIHVERQVSTTSKHRIDLWIPGCIMLELKAGKVISDDVCQALDYYSHYRKPVALVGESLTEKASRGIAAFNRVVDGDMIMFLTWGGVKPFLTAITK